MKNEKYTSSSQENMWLIMVVDLDLDCVDCVDVHGDMGCGMWDEGSGC